MSGQKRFTFGMLHARWDNLKKRFYNIFEHQVLEIKEKPSKVAVGCALGLSINFFPTFGLGFIFALILATVFRVNKVSATAISLLTGPLIPLKYAFNLLVGGIIYTHGKGSESLMEIITAQYTLIFKLGPFSDKLLSFLDFFGSTFMVGALINAAAFGTAFYFFVELILKKKYSKPSPR